MTREDCMWVARRCTGLLLIAAAIIALPSLVGAWYLFEQMDANLSLIADVDGFGRMRSHGQGAARAALTTALLQVFIPLIAGLLFLFGLPGAFVRDAVTTAKRVGKGEI